MRFLPKCCTKLLVLLWLWCDLLHGQPNNLKKSVGINLYSKWAQTPLYLEAAEFFGEESNTLFWDYVHALKERVLQKQTETTKSMTPKEQYDLVEELAELLLPRSLRSLLQFSISLRSHSITIAMFNQIALQSLSRNPQKCSTFIELSTLDSNSESFSRIHCSFETAQKAIESLLQQSNANLLQPNIYKVDHPYPRNLPDSGNLQLATNVIAIVYGDLGSKKFYEMFDQLQSLADQGAINLYYRPFLPKPERPEKVSLSGYGIELQIKSTEYKAQDDTRVKGEEGQLTEKLIKKDLEKITEVDGINFLKLRQRFPDKEEKLNKMLDGLIEASKEIATLKIWELQELSLQTAKKVLQAPKSEQLRLLRDITQNFPVYAKSLVKISVEQELRKEIERNQQQFMQQLNVGTGDTALFINGMFFDMDSVDIFTLTHFLKQETRLVSGLHRILNDDHEQIRSLLRLDIADDKSDYQIDIRDSSVIYINDIENDKIYRNWPSSIQDLLRPTYPGMLRNVRKNLYHLVLIVDPGKKESFDIIKLAESFYVHKAPLRIGFVFAVNPDRSVDGFHDAGVACLNAFNYISQEATSYEALSFLTDVIATAATHNDLSSSTVINLFKSRYSKAKMDFVFGEDSEYDSGRTLAWDFLNRTAIGKPVQALLNGVLIKENQLNGDMFEEAVLTEIMKQTPILQRSVYRGDITDSMNVLDYLMSQKQVIPRLNKKILYNNENTKFVDLSYIPSDAKNSDRGSNEQNKLAQLNQKIQYLSTSDDECYPITLWLVADFSTQAGQELLGTAMNYLRESSKDIRIGIVYQKINEQARIINTLLQTISDSERAAGLLAKLSEKSISMDAIKSILSSELVDEYEQAYDNFDASQLTIHQIVSSQVLDVSGNEFAIVSNGKVIKSCPEEPFVENDFSLIEKHSMSSYGNKVFSELRKYKEETKHRCSDIVMSVSNVLISNPVSKTRHNVRFHGERHSVIKISAQDETRPAIELVAIFEPLSRGAQKITPILLALQNIVNANIRIFLNCIEKHSDMPLKSFFRFVINEEPNFTELTSEGWPQNTALFDSVPTSPLFTLGMVTPENWMVESVSTPYDLDNIHLDEVDGYGVFADFELEHLLLEGHCFEQSSGNPPRGLQFILSSNSSRTDSEQSLDYDKVQDTIVMANLGYFQLKANPGAWNLQLRPGRSEQIYTIVGHENTEPISSNENVIALIQNFRSNVVKVRVSKRPDKVNEELLFDSDDTEDNSLWNSISSWTSGSGNGPSKQSSQELSEAQKDSERINIFSVASGHLYERLLRIMMLSVLKNTETPVKFWFLKNYLSPTFKNILPIMSEKYGFDYELVQYKWPRWLHQQTEKQRVIWGYKILFLDVLFPLDVKKIIFVDADQVVRTDLKELRDFDLGGAPYGYTPFCESREDMDGFRFWKHGYWASHLQGRKYHISALYVVDLVKFRRIAAGDRLRGQYQGLSQDPNSLSNLDQDLPNNMIHQVAIKSLPQEWLWCETWCDDKSKGKAKTIDLCNNPKTKEPKLTAAKRILPEWKGYDEEIKQLIDEYYEKKRKLDSLSISEDDISRNAFESTEIEFEKEVVAHTEL